MDLRSIARQLGGDVAGRSTVNCPGPGHSHKDRSLSVTFDPNAPDGFIVNSFAARDDWRHCRDFICSKLGITADTGKKTSRFNIFETKTGNADTASALANAERALALWRESTNITGTLAETYLQGRGLGACASSNLRFHPSCPFGPGQRHPCLVALYRDIETDEPRAIHRTALTPDGQKIDRMTLGPKRGCAIKLDDNAEVTVKLTIAEGIETALAGAALGYRPIWATGDAGEISRFPVLPGVESLTILVDNDLSGTGQLAARECSQRWTSAGHEVFRVVPKRIGNDIADLMRSA